MTIELYDALETRLSLEALRSLSSALPEPFLLLGGWAVYLSVNDSYRREHGSDYLGSRDVDVGFHVDPLSDPFELREGNFAKALNVLKDNGYFPLGSYRFCKIVEKSSQRVLSEDAAKRIPMHELFYLYVDAMVDWIHPAHESVFGLKPLDEPILGKVFQDEAWTVIDVDGIVVGIPAIEHLLATKLRSIVTRDREDKLIKDACDIYALIWHSNVPFRDLVNRTRILYPHDCDSALNVLTTDVTQRASRHLGIDANRFEGVIGNLRGRIR